MLFLQLLCVSFAVTAPVAALLPGNHGPIRRRGPSTAKHHQARFQTFTEDRELQEVCPDEVNAVNDCFRDEAHITCSTCINDLDLAQSIGSSACQNVEDGICFAITNTCDCIPCEEELEAVYSCLVDEVGFSCPSLDCGFETAPPLPTEPGTFTQSFSVYWFTILWQTDTTCSAYEDLNIEISCAEGDAITFQEATHDSISCQKTANNVLRCTDDGDVQNFVWEAVGSPNTGVFYQCTGSSLGGTTATVEDSEASCDVVADGGVYGYHMAIASLCSDNYLSSGSFLECPDFEGQKQTSTQRFHCIGDTDIPETSGPQQLPFPTVAIQTSLQSTSILEDYECYSFEAANQSTSAVALPTTSLPFSSPPPTVAAALLPSAAPASSSTFSPIASLTVSPTAVDTSASMAASSWHATLLLGVVAAATLW